MGGLHWWYACFAVEKNPLPLCGIDIWNDGRNYEQTRLGEQVSGPRLSVE
jgi:hypothetical protein